MEVMLNATLAGGVVMGAAADMVNWPFGCMIAGWSVGALSVIGFAYIGPFLKRKIGLSDTCGIHNLHAMPGLWGGIVAAIAANREAQDYYGSRYNEFYTEGAYGRTPHEAAGF
jgi:ammonium transporter Rh